MGQDNYLEEIESDPIETTTVDGATISQDGENIVVDLDGGLSLGEGNEDDGSFDENLAVYIDESDRRALGLKFVDWIQDDIESRSKWRKRMKAGLEIIGIDEIPAEHSAFEGSSTVNHPAIAEAIVRFQANAMEELWPAEGPVKCGIVGESSVELEEQALRVQNFMNYQLTDADEEAFDHTDQMTMYLPYAGSAFKKVYFDQTVGQSISRFVTAEDFIVPYDATSLKTSSRYTHRYSLTGNEVNARIFSGEFLETDSLDPDGEGKYPSVGTDNKDFEDVSDDRDPFRAEDDVTYTLYEMHVEYVFDEFDDPDGEEDFKVALPYVVTIEVESGEILAIRRLWNEEDPKRTKRVHFIHYKFLPGFGFYGWGYLHIIGALGKAASGALRALLDGSATASLQGGFKSREAKLAGDFIFTPGVWKDVDMTSEDLSKAFYTPPFKEPSPALFHTLELLVNGIQGFSSTTEAMTGAQDNNGPVGTTLALIEQGSKVYSGIHKRMHKAARFEFKLLAQLNYEHMDEEYPYDVTGGDRSIARSDFDSRVDVLPVSDPNIYSNVQRVAQAQAELELVESAPDLYDQEAKRQAHLDMHRALRTPNPERLLPKSNTKRMDPVTENQIILTGGSVEAFVEQDHASHIKAHELFVQEAQGMGLDPQIMQAAQLNMSSHLAEHHAYGYRLRIEQELDTELPDTDFKAIRDAEDMDIEMDNAVARAVAENIAPPPPPQGPEPSPEEQAQAEHEQKLKHTDETHGQSMQFKSEDHKQAMAITGDKASQSTQIADDKGDQEHRKKAADNLLDSAGRAAKLSDE